MKLSELGLNRFMYKEVQDIKTSDSSDMPDNNILQEQNNNKDSREYGSRNILTGTVISSCFIITSDLPARVELFGNDIKLYDDSKGGGGQISGNTSTITFARADKNPGEFILQKRHGKDQDLDNVMEMFFKDRTAGKQNYLFIGRDGSDEKNNTNYIEITADSNSDNQHPSANGSVGFRLSRDGNIYMGSGIVLFDTASGGGEGAIGYIAGEGDNGGVVLGWSDANGVLQHYITIDNAGITMNPSPTGGAKFGSVSSGGTSGYVFPDGWSSTKIGTGIYRVTHNLGDSYYVAMVTVRDVQDVTCHITQNVNFFTVYTRDAITNAPVDSNFNFVFYEQ